MAVETQTREGRCATHGSVEATREIPRMGFPFFVFAIKRAIAKRKPYLCPVCGSAVETH